MLKRVGLILFLIIISCTQMSLAQEQTPEEFFRANNITYSPPVGWEKAQFSKKTMFFVSQDKEASVAVGINPKPMNWASFRLGIWFMELFSKTKVVGKLKFLGYPCYILEVFTRNEADTITIKNTSYMILKGDKVYTVNYSADVNFYEEYYNVFSESLKTFYIF